MKVNIICKDTYWDLEKAVNDFLSKAEGSGKKVMDIKFSGEGNHSPYSIGYWSAMIIME